MKKFIYKIHILLLIFIAKNELYSQVVYPPNHSFEDDTSMQSVFPWNVSGNFFFLTSLNMNFPTDGKMFIGLESVKKQNSFTNSRISIKFPISERIRYLNFQSIFGSQFDFFKFNVKIEFTKFNQFYNRSFVVCSIDSFMDTISNYRPYRNKWSFHKLDLKSHYKNMEIPDSCYIEFNCDIKYRGIYDFSQTLFLDNIVLTGNVDAQVSVQDQFKSAVDVKVYPNPSEGSFIVDLSALTDVAKLEVLSANGQTVMFLDDPEELIHLDLSAYARSCYLLKIVSTNGNVQCKKLLLE